MFLSSVNMFNTGIKSSVEATGINLRGYNDDVDYDKYNDFFITDNYGLTMLATAVEDYDRNFKGKTVTLTRDLDLDGADYGINGTFSGTLDGDGYVISNFNISSYDYKGSYDNYGQGVHIRRGNWAYGLFTKLDGGTIKNLALDNFTCKFDASSYKKASSSEDSYLTVTVGGICNVAVNGTIQGCKVTNFKFIKGHSPNWDRKFYICSGITNSGSCLIEDCFVYNVTSEYDGIINGVTYDNTLKLKNCIVDGVFDNKFINNESNSSLIENCKSEPNDISGLDWNSKGGTYSDVDIIWYYASEYNDGWPLLRVFMKDWKQVTVISNPSNYAQLGSSSKFIYIPQNAYNTYSGEILNNGHEAKIVIYDQEVVLKAKDKYLYKSWKCNNSASYVAILEPIKFTLVFKDAIIETPNGPITIKPSSTTMEIPYGETLETMKSGNQYIYKYETDSYGMAVVYDLGEANEYVLVSWDLPNEENSWVVGEDYEGADYTIYITPTFKLKEYGWIFM